MVQVQAQARDQGELAQGQGNILPCHPCLHIRSRIPHHLRIRIHIPWNPFHSCHMVQVRGSMAQAQDEQAQAHAPRDPTNFGNERNGIQR